MVQRHSGTRLGIVVCIFPSLNSHDLVCRGQPLTAVRGGHEVTQGRREGIRYCLCLVLQPPSAHLGLCSGIWVQSEAVSLLCISLSFGLSSATMCPGFSGKESQAWAGQELHCLSKGLSSWEQDTPASLASWWYIPQFPVWCWNNSTSLPHRKTKQNKLKIPTDWFSYIGW